MNAIICWLNNNNGALMVLITLVYVIATISISHSNRKSAEASREQILSSQKQQEQNVGVQLYAMRKETIFNVMQKLYNFAQLDILALFNDDLFAEYQKVAEKEENIKKLQCSIDQFELTLSALVGKEKHERVKQKRAMLSPNDDLTLLKDCVSQALSNLSTSKNLSNSVEEYIETVAEVRELRLQQDAENDQLVQKLTDFLKESIQ